MWHVLRSVPLENNVGLGGLYRGLHPALLRQCTYGTLKVVSYEEFKHQLTWRWPELPFVAASLMSSVLAGTISSAMCTPTDLIKVRMQAGNRQYNSIWHAGTSIVHNEGWLALYKGIAPTTQRAVAVTVMNLSSYDVFKSSLMSYGFRDDVVVYLVGSTFTGVVSTYGTQPIDVVKSRIMNQPCHPVSGKGMLYRSSWHCFRTTVQQEGWQALWKGSVPSLCRSVPWLVAFWLSFEGLKGLALQH